jgi:hypothetical protein
MTGKPPKRRKSRSLSRDTLFSPVDDEIFAEALRQEFPGTVFLERSAWKQPPAPIFGSIMECSDRRKIHILAPDGAGWIPQIEQYSDGWYSLSEWPERRLDFVLSRWDWGPEFIQAKWAWDPPTLSAGWIWGAYWPEEENRRVFLHRAMRLVERIATNRVKKGHPLGNAMMGVEKVLMEDGEGGDTWVGHHALEWCTEQPRRMLDGCIRPRDDWKPPDDPWYRALRGRVLAK